MTREERVDAQAPLSEPQAADPLSDLISKVLTKAFSGHWIGQVNAADLAFQVLADAVLCHTLGSSTAWAQEILRTKVIGTLRVSDKRKLVEDALRHLGMEASELANVMKVSAALTTLRNTMAHSAIDLGLEGLLFEGYNRGRDTIEEIPPKEIMAIIEAAEQGWRAISTFV